MQHINLANQSTKAQNFGSGLSIKILVELYIKLRENWIERLFTSSIALNEAYYNGSNVILINSFCLCFT